MTTITHATPEVACAERAALIAGPGSRPVAPPVVTVEDGRPVLRRVTGPRLHEMVAAGTALDLLCAAGGVLACLHAAPAPTDRAAAAEGVPWGPVPLAIYLGLTPTERAIVTRLHSGEELRKIALRDDRAPGLTWCHGDAKADNFCVSDGEPVLIDWECSGLGSPEIDLGSLLGSVLALRLADAAGAVDGPRAVRDALEDCLRDSRTPVAAVLDGYAAAGGADLDCALLARRVGTALVCRAYTRPARRRRDRVVAVLLEIGLGLLSHPERWESVAGARRG